VKVYRYRKYFQTLFLLLFFALLTLTVWPLGKVYLGAFLLADPLIALNSLFNGVFKWEMLLAFFFLLLPFFLGRAFCGYVCPLGFIIELTGPKQEKLKKSKAREILLKLPLLILVFFLILILFQSSLFLIFDPLSTLTRTSTTFFYPLLDRIARSTGDSLYKITPLQGVVDSITTFISGYIIFQKPLSYQLQSAILILFLVIIFLSFLTRRLWCRHLCPLGALLGFLSRFSLFGRVVDEEKCIKCLKCENVCPLDAVRKEGLSTDKSRCELSFECAEVCPTGAVRFGLKPKSLTYDPSRRAFLAVTGAALLSGFLLKNSLLKAEGRAGLIRPPGARKEEDFLSLCSRCGQCMKVCPTNVLQPSLFSNGAESLFTPEMNFDHAYCDFSCNECTKVCPTGAIEYLPLNKKRKEVIGRAYIDRNRCIPWVDFKNCLVCEELCPVPEKAIVFRVERERNPEGKLVTLKKPLVIVERCIGCGVCQFNCPVPYESAIVVKAVK
jgi:ferredoxin-type protein NapF